MKTDKLTDALRRWQSLDSLLNYFRSESRCEEFLLKILHPEGIRCPKCGGIVVYKCGRLYHCDECNTTFSVKVGTIFQSTKLPLRKWYATIWLILNNKKGISASMLSRELGVTYTTAWHMLHKLRRTMGQSSDKLRGTVQVDAAYVGGQLRWIAYKGDSYGPGSYLRNKVSVLGLSGDRLVLKVIDEGNWVSVRPILEKYLSAENIVHSDQGKEFMRIGRDLGLLHFTCNHEIKQFVSPNGASTNRVEGAWSHLKRHQRGIYHLLPRKYAQYYIDEFVWRYNTREMTYVERVKNYFPNISIVITWKELIR